MYLSATSSPFSFNPPMPFSGSRGADPDPVMFDIAAKRLVRRVAAQVSVAGLPESSGKGEEGMGGTEEVFGS